ncbi:MAG: glucosamine-6-phosphate deaminase [Spirochaetales bacterium]|nr:glucosamine-6-phosphate deaminase [Spirochaetales bacterium]
MRLIIEKDYKNISKWSANYIAHAILKAAPTSAKPFVLGLPTGSTPIGTYKELIRHYKHGVISFEHVITFNMDEYIGLPQDHPQSYSTFMWENFFSFVDIKKENVNIPNGNAADLEKECLEYEGKITAAGGIDLFLGGIGSDGHIAFNEPGSSLASHTRMKTLTYDTIVANSRNFNNDLSKVPKTALTVGIQTIMDAGEVVILVNGYKKAMALQKTVEGNVNHMWTCSILQMHPHAIIVCDEDAIVEMKVGTVKYFKEIESANINPATQLYN